MRQMVKAVGNISFIVRNGLLEGLL